MIKIFKKILHLHPNEKYANIFVLPLIEAENNSGYTSKLATMGNYNIFLLFGKLFNYKPDIVIIHNSVFATLPLLVARILFIKQVIYFNHGVPYIGYKGILRTILLLIEQLNCKLAHRIFTVSRGMQEILEKITTKEIILLEPGSVCGLPSDLKKRSNLLDVRENYAINKNTKVFCFIGRPNSRKGFDLVLKLWNKFFLDDPDCFLILCGPSEQDLFKRGYTKKENNIMAMGFTENVPSVLKAADVLIHPSFHEGLSYTLLEALTIGCPIVASNIPGINSVISNQSNGICFELEGSNEEIINNIYRSILFVLNNKKKISKIKQNGFKTARTFRRKLIITQYISKINGIVEDSKKNLHI